jgi:heavy metal sensor kinase
MTLPIRVRLTIWYTALLALILTVGGVFVVLSLRANLTRTLDQTLQTSAHEIAADYKPTAGSSESEFRDVTDVSLAGLPRDASAAQLVAVDGTIQVSAGNALATTPILPAPDVAATIGGATTLRTLTLGGQDYRVYATPFTQGGTTTALVVATSLGEVEAAAHRLTLLLLIGIPVGVAVAAAGGWWLARKALRPVAVMTEEASAIGASRLGDRVEVPPTMDELGRLAVTLNAMLDRLQRGVEQQRAFVSNASHELRTPLAVMRAEIDVSLATEDLSAAARAVLVSAREETERMSAIVEDLLVLARMDEGALRLTTEPVALPGLADDVLATMAPIARERGVQLVLEQGATTTVVADPDRVRQVVRNLVDNALKHAPRDGHVTVDVRTEGAFGEVSVADDGPGIAAEHLPRVFDRFYRVDDARSREVGGSGLGLAIVRELVEAQGGRVWVRSGSRGGAVFGFTLPLVPADADGHERPD